MSTDRMFQNLSDIGCQKDSNLLTLLRYIRTLGMTKGKGQGERGYSTKQIG